MKVKRVVFALLLVMTAASVVFAADDGPLFTRNISRTPDTMTGGAQLSVMDIYIPAQNTQGELITLDYLTGDKDNSTIAYSRTEAKPLIATYNDGIEVDEKDTGGDLGIMTGAGFGERDAFAAWSLDDGSTWKNYNLSDSAARSSFVLKNGHDYPGDVFKISHSVVGNKVLVAWISRYCESGSPLYAWEPDDQLALADTYGLGTNLDVDGVTYNTYASDLFGVAGNQKSVDYTLQGFPEVGEVPYGCVWVARGTLEQDADTDLYGIIWRQSERLTSGRRDANRIEVTGTGGAGFIISWQEDPEGLRPGKGLGPGEGWSGAIANSKTDIWYTYIGWDDFDDVCLDDEVVCEASTLTDLLNDRQYDETKPKVAVPFAVPMRLTDNNQCKPDLLPTNAGYLPYCYADFDGTGTSDLCASEATFENGAGQPVTVCVAEDGRVLTGRTASTRVRWAIKPYTNADGETSAWVLMGEEKMKALGSELDENGDPIDIGKNMWYHTFEFNNPELVQQGLMLNSPALDPLDGLPLNDVPLVDEWGNEYYETEIARRFNLMVQGIGAAMASESQTSAILIYKEGILFQGGPADIFTRRVVLPDTFDPAVDNPFAYENVQCVEFADDGTAMDVALLYDDGSNPNYVRGLCPVQGMNVSGTTIVSCDDGSGGETCADNFPWEGSEDQNSYPKVTEWVQGTDNFNDPSWANPYDVSKGHRGFIDGDFVMMMYATAPNWKANTIGNESYNLYLRRSFDGGQTWTTLPASYTHINGTTYNGAQIETCEDYGWGGADQTTEVCTTYQPGDFEQARNVSRLVGTRITVLDPRYSPSGGMLKEDYTSLLCYDETAADGAGDWVNCGYTEPLLDYPEETRDPSVYFVTYETGDNTVVTEETGTVPLDMYYSRASNFGDDYDLVEFTTSSGELVERWDWLENGPELAVEASVLANPLGDRFYTVWNQELEIAPEVFTDMDVEFRRIFYNLTDTESYPTLAILSDVPTEVPYSPDEELIFIGTGRDTDRMGEGQQGQGIDAYEWSSDIDGVLSTEQVFTVAATDLTMGLHTFTFSVQDNEGNTSSTSVTVGVGVANTSLHKVFLPVLLR
jgi:hypothetical protein